MQYCFMKLHCNSRTGTNLKSKPGVGRHHIKEQLNHFLRGHLRAIQVFVPWMVTKSPLR